MFRTTNQISLESMVPHCRAWHWAAQHVQRDRRHNVGSPWTHQWTDRQSLWPVIWGWLNIGNAWECHNLSQCSCRKWMRMMINLEFVGYLFLYKPKGADQTPRHCMVWCQNPPIFCVLILDPILWGMVEWEKLWVVSYRDSNIICSYSKIWNYALKGTTGCLHTCISKWKLPYVHIHACQQKGYRGM